MATKKKKAVPDTELGVGVITETMPATLLDQFPLEKGTEVRIARIINTPVGLRFRIFGTTKWIPEKFITCDFDKKHIVDYTRNLNKTKLLSQSGDAKIPKGLKPHKEADITNYVSRMRHKLKRKSNMDNLKKDLKEAIAALSTGDTLSVTFLSMMPSDNRYNDIRSLAGQTVEATLVETKKGRGKGGSQLMVLQPTAGGDKVVVGTPHSDVVLNLVMPDGKLVGHETEAEVPKTFDTDAGQAATLRPTFQSLVGKVGSRVRVESTVDEYSGEFTVDLAEQLRGRHGQVRLSLRSDAGQTTQLWSYRHSGVVTAFEVLSEGTVPEVMPVAADTENE